MTEALQVNVTAAVASFRNPLYAGVQVGLPCPPPSTIAGLLAGAAGGWNRIPIDVRFAAAFTADGSGTDLETYHPLDGRGRASAATPKDREFLAQVELTIWLIEDLKFWADALRRPVWPLRLGRSQDLAAARTKRVELVGGPGRQGHAIVPEALTTAGLRLRLPTVLSTDRARNRWNGYRYAPTGSDLVIDTGWSVPGHDGEPGQAIAMLEGVHPAHFGDGTPSRDLVRLRAKSPSRALPRGEALIDHLASTLTAAQRLEQRIARIDAVPEQFWRWVKVAALTHDAGKVAEGFQEMVTSRRGPVWGQRHEVYSLGFIADLLSSWPIPDQAWAGIGALAHHRPLTGTAGNAIFATYQDTDVASFTARFGTVDPRAQQQLRHWLAMKLREHRLDEEIPETSGDIAEAGFRLLEQLREQWEWPEDVAPEDNLTAVLIQGAVTLSDHVSSAHGQLLTHQPIDADFADRFTTEMATSRRPLHPHQRRAAATGGHLMLRTPTGSGKTEAALLWAAGQVTRIRGQRGGQPRVFYLLPYLASINAMVDRIATALGDDDMVGVVHSKAAAFHLHRSLCGDDESDPAGRAVSRAAATRLFRELVRVGTPYQLLRGALAGTSCSSILIDAANSVFVLDELHSYEPKRLGMILASIGFWVSLGGRIGVVTATMPQQLVALLGESVGDGFEQVRAEGTAWPQRHRLVIGSDHLTASSSEIGHRLRAGQSVLVVANNIADALALHEELGPVCRELHGEDSVLLLHARFKTADRAQIESRIRDRFGTGRPHAPGLLIATQVVEVSLDVSFDALHTSGAPLEALIQRFGRVNRTADGPLADVVVHPPHYSRSSRGGDELADGVYDHEPTELTMSVLQSHNGTPVDEQQLGTWLDTLYESPWGRRWADNVRLHRNSFAHHLRFDGALDGDRNKLGEEFEALFDGVEAILSTDRDAYKDALNSVDDRRAGRLLGSQHLIPLPHYGKYLARYDRALDVLVIDGIYDPTTGLTGIEHEQRDSYQLGEVI